MRYEISFKLQQCHSILSQDSATCLRFCQKDPACNFYKVAFGYDQFSTHLSITHQWIDVKIWIQVHRDVTFFFFSIIQPWTENLPSAFSMIPADVRSSMIIINIILINIIVIIITLFPLHNDCTDDQIHHDHSHFDKCFKLNDPHCSRQVYEAPPECVMSKENCLGIQVSFCGKEINWSPNWMMQKRNGQQVLSFSFQPETNN